MTHREALLLAIEALEYRIAHAPVDEPFQVGKWEEAIKKLRKKMSTLGLD